MLSLPKQLAKENKKFQYKLAIPGGDSQKFGTAIEWLEYAGLVLRCNKVTSGEVPLKAYEEPGSFKLYYNDIGIAGVLTETPIKTALQLETVDNTFLGALIENYVATCFASARKPLWYWTSKATAEVDFILQDEDTVIPIEVKKGVRAKSKSLQVYRNTYNPSKSVRTSAKNFGESDGIIALPLYALEFWLSRL